MARKRKKLIAARIEKNLSQEELAEHLGADRTSVSYWENVGTMPSLYFKKRIKAFFGVEDLDDFLAVTEEPPPGEDETFYMEPTPSQDDSNAPTPVTSCVWRPHTPTVQQFIASDPARHFWQIAHTDYDTPDEMTADIQAAIKDMNMMTGDLITRRDALCELASVPMIAMGKTQTLKASRRGCSDFVRRH